MAKRRMLELRVAAAPAGEDDVKTLDDIIDGLRVEIKQAGLSTEGNGPADDIDTFDLFVLDKEGARCKVLVRWGDKTWTWMWLGDLLDDRFVMQQHDQRARWSCSRQYPIPTGFRIPIPNTHKVQNSNTQYPQYPSIGATLQIKSQ